MAADAEAAASEGPPELAALERELTQQVPSLLESMNRASAEVNASESRLGEAQDRYNKLLEQWSRLYEDLRLQHGANIERVKPYFDAKQVLNAASRRVHTVVREFSAAASLHTQAKVELRSIEEDLAYGAHKVALDSDQQDGLSRATVRVLKCQQERDRREQEYARALREYEEAKEASQAWHLQIGDAVISRTLPSFRQLAHHQSTLAEEQARINALTERARHAKAAYHSSMRELDRINVAVHAARRKHRGSAGEAEVAARRAAPLAEVAVPPKRGAPGAVEEVPAESPLAAPPCEAPLEEPTAASEEAPVEAARLQEAPSQETPSRQTVSQETPPQETPPQEALEETAATPEAPCPSRKMPPQEAAATLEAPPMSTPRTAAPPGEASSVPTAEAAAVEAAVEPAPAPATKSLGDGAKALLEPPAEAAVAETGRAAEPRAAPECEPEAEPLGASP